MAIILIIVIMAMFLNSYHGDVLDEDDSGDYTLIITLVIILIILIIVMIVRVILMMVMIVTMMRCDDKKLAVLYHTQEYLICKHCAGMACPPTYYMVKKL